MKKFVFCTVLSICLSSVYSQEKPPLFQAVLKSDLKEVIKLVEKEADIDKGAYGRTPLEQAAFMGNLEIVEYLLKKGAQSPQKAFEAAIDTGKENIIEYLLKGGFVDINRNARFLSSLLNNKKIPFDTRIQNLKNLTAGKLNSPYLLAFVDKEYFQKVIDFFGINLSDKVDDLGNTILHIAASRNNLDLVIFLIEKKININALDSNNQTALFYAITSYGPMIDWSNPVTENETIAKINFKSDMPYYNDPRSIQEKQISIVTALLDAGININQQNKAGWTVLHFASAYYPEGLQDFLISKGANQKLKTTFGRNATDILALRQK